MKTKQTRPNNIWFIDTLKYDKTIQNSGCWFPLGRKRAIEEGHLGGFKGTSNAWFLRLSVVSVQASRLCCYSFSLSHMCTFHTLSHRMKIIQPLHHTSPTKINVPSSHRLDHWRCLKEVKPDSSLTLGVLFALLLDSWRGRGQSKTEPCLGLLLLLG